MNEGLILLIDDETGTYWDHITGEGLYGPLKGKCLPSWPIHHTTVGGALARWPELTVHRLGARTPAGWLMRKMHRRSLHNKGFLPPPFRLTMSEGDPRLPEMTNGLGVIVDDRARFYPMKSLQETLEESWGDQTLRIGLNPIDGAPTATWENGERPMQLLARWYGFSTTFPDCEIAK